MKQKTLSPKAIEFNLSLEGCGFEKVLAGLLAHGRYCLRLPTPISLPRNRDSGLAIFFAVYSCGAAPVYDPESLSDGIPFSVRPSHEWTGHHDFNVMKERR